MAHWESNVHMTDDVLWPWKVKLVTPIRLQRNIWKTGFKDSFPKDHQQEMAYGLSDGHSPYTVIELENCPLRWSVNSQLISTSSRKWTDASHLAQFSDSSESNAYHNTRFSVI